MMPSYQPTRCATAVPSAATFSQQCRTFYVSAHSMNVGENYPNDIVIARDVFERECAWLALSAVHKAIFDRALGAAHALLMIVHDAGERRFEDDNLSWVEIMDACTCMALDAAQAGHAALCGYEAPAGVWLVAPHSRSDIASVAQY
jgi:hypothetical protein